MPATATSSRLLPHIGSKHIALAIVVLALSAFVLYAVVREATKQPPAPPAPSAAAAFTGGLGMDRSSLGALSPEEESYAAALWPIHSEVKTAAMRMTMAGLYYKIENKDPATVKEAVQPLTATFQSAEKRARQIRPPQSLEDAHQSYMDALDLYIAASREMVKVAADGRDEHLITAHARSQEASHQLLKLSDVLWPGEYKPN
jgi:hypothetical protein